MSRAWSRGSTRAWRRVRAAVLRSNEYENAGQCRLAIPGICTGHANEVHHTKPRAEVGDDPRYLQAVCRECNLRVSDPTATPTHTAVVSWVRDNQPVSFRAVRAAFPHIDASHLSVIISRAVKRREIERVGAGMYRAGPTGLPTTTAKDEPRRASSW